MCIIKCKRILRKLNLFYFNSKLSFKGKQRRKKNPFIADKGKIFENSSIKVAVTSNQSRNRIRGTINQELGQVVNMGVVTLLFYIW